VPRLSLYFRDDVYTGIDDLATQYASSYIEDVTLLSFRLAYYTPDNDINLVLFVDNLSDEDYFQGGFSQSGALGAATLVKGSPRSYGLEATYYF